ncbi:hypothetical protein [Clostridium sp. 'White wine YQ']|uniref:hypothetical protein n=1 Tax=Clostridium sp. 'White wine YQ' TaxID=3027474 RepID=UPI0023656F57|nr:hypothetical protein [Clostridium sp. 'White wine YQ']MDD7796041.1 hypothetical protein [Clostridium sp. 'White wine YQ']
MGEIDKRNKLEEEPFNFNVSKDNKVFIYWSGKLIKILKGKESEKFLQRIKNADTKEAQLIMAKVTGNFKHGNEKYNKKM